MYCFGKQIIFVFCLIEQLIFCKSKSIAELEEIKKLNDDLDFNKRNATLVGNQKMKFHELGKKGNKCQMWITMKTIKNLKPQSMEMEENVENLKKGFEKFQKQVVNPETRTISTRGNRTKFLNKRKKTFFRKKLSKKENEKKIIYVLGLFDLTELERGEKNKGFETSYRKKKEGESEIWAAKLALSHVNKLKLCGGHQLKMIINDTKCEAGAAIDALFHAIFSLKSHIPILFDCGCSLATATLASITPYWNIIQISCGVTSPVLSKREKFPLFYRVTAPKSNHNPEKLTFIRHFRWNTVTFVSQNEKEYILAMNYFIIVLEANNITCEGTITFGKSMFQEQLQLLKVYELGLFGKDYAWILQGNFKKDWWKNQSECPLKTLKLVTQGIFFVTSYDFSERSHSFPVNFTRKDLKLELFKLNITITKYARESYDAIWVAALALNNSLKNLNQTKISIKDFKYNNYNISLKIFKNIGLINLIGMSGPIFFDGADRVGVTAFSQLQDEKIVTVAIYYPTSKLLNFSCNHCKEILWKGSKVPISQRFVLKKIETISFQTFLWMCCISGMSISFAIFFLILNTYFSEFKNIKLLSPKLNKIAVTGCIAMYLGVFLLNLDFGTLPNINYFPIICTAKVYFFSAGFSLSFGSIFAKTYRVHKIFIKNQVGILLLIDGFILSLWVILDPFQRKLYNTTIEFSNSNRSVIYQTQIEVCSCKYLNGWLSFLYLYKGLLLFVGVFLAWKTRQVKVPGFNDPQYILFSVYIVVITCCIVVVFTRLIFEKPTVSYFIISITILSSTTATWCLLLYPNVKVVFSKSGDNIDSIMRSIGLILEENTRRFVKNDAREKLHQMEVSNKVYKKEISTLSNEMSRLEKKLLCLPHSSSSSPSINYQLAKHHKNYQSLPELTVFSDPFAKDLPGKILMRGWPSNINKSMTFENSKNLHQDTTVQVLANSNSKFTCDKEYLQNMFNTP